MTAPNSMPAANLHLHEKITWKSVHRYLSKLEEISSISILLALTPHIFA